MIPADALPELPFSHTAAPAPPPPSAQDTGAGALLQHMMRDHQYRITTVPALHDLSDLVAQCVFQPGMSRVILELAVQSFGSEFYVKEQPVLVGLTFGQARRMYDGATLCGVINRRTGGHI